LQHQGSKDQAWPKCDGERADRDDDPPSATRNRFDRLASSSSPPGSWLNKPARLLALRTRPMFCWIHFSSARRTATNGPNPDCIPARKRLTPSSPLRLVLEGDEVIASDDAVMALAITFADETRRSAMLILASPQHDNLQSLRDVRRSLPPPFAPTDCRQILRSQVLPFRERRCGRVIAGWSGNEIARRLHEEAEAACGPSRPAVFGAASFAPAKPPAVRGRGRGLPNAF
jgi:hypothetical protein